MVIHLFVHKYLNLTSILLIKIIMYIKIMTIQANRKKYKYQQFIQSTKLSLAYCFIVQGNNVNPLKIN